MRARQAVVCPKCGAFNRPTWEYCPRCSESLAGAQPAKAVVPEAGVEGEPDARSSVVTTFASLGLLLALGVAGAVAWRYGVRAPEPARPDPRMFTIGTQPPAQPVPPPLSGPGAVDYDAGRRLMNAGDFAGAAARLGAAAAANPANAGYRYAYAFALWRGGDRQGALVQYAEAARLDPGLALQYARSLDAAGRSADAAREYETILAQSPGAVAVQEDLGRLLFRSADYTRAVPHLQAAVLARPDDPVLQQELAYSLDQAGDRRQAEAAYRQVIGSAPQAVLSRGLLAENLVEQGRKDEALAVLMQGLALTPDIPLLQRQLGSVLERTGRQAEAAAAYRTYARLAPNAPDAAEIAGRAVRLETAGRKP
jgi:Flp pilus assembly protein TadD